MTMRWTGALLVMAVAIASEAAAGNPCSYAWRPYKEGAVSCQNGRQFRCADGAWQDIGTTCADEDPGSEGAAVRPGVNVPAVKDPSVRQPGAPGGPPPVDQPPPP